MSDVVDLIIAFAFLPAAVIAAIALARISRAVQAAAIEVSELHRTLRLHIFGDDTVFVDDAATYHHASCVLSRAQFPRASFEQIRNHPGYTPCRLCHSAEMRDVRSRG